MGDQGKSVFFGRGAEGGGEVGVLDIMLTRSVSERVLDKDTPFCCCYKIMVGYL